MWRGVLLAGLILAVVAQTGLTDSNFEQFLADNPYTFVKFFAPWCGHCRKMAEEFVKLHEEARDFAVAEVDCTSSESLCEKHQVESYPTLRLFVSDHSVPYEGERKAKDMANWLQQYRTVELKTLTSDELRELKSRETIVVGTGLSESQIRTVKSASLVQKDTPFYLAEGNTPEVTLYLRGHQPIQYSLSQLSPSNLSKWVFNHKRETILHLSDSHNIQYLKTQKDFAQVLVLIDNGQDKSSDTFLSVHDYCKAHKTTLLCATIPKDDSNLHLFEDSFNFKVEDHVIVLLRNRYTVGYAYPTGHPQSSDDVSSFVEKARADALPKAFDHKTSKNTTIEYKNVKQLDSTTYNSTLSDNPFVLVEYYSPNCGHCTRFAKDYDQIASQLKQDVLVAAVDVVKETTIAEWENIQAYPTFKIFVRGDAIKYEGTRTVEAMVQFAIEFARSRLLIVQKKQDLNLPAVAIVGIEAKSSLHSLPALYNRLPIYMVPGDTISVEIHEQQGIKTYEGEYTLAKVFEWLETETSPVLVNLGYPTPCPKLKKGMQNHLPILTLVIKGHHPANFPLEFLQIYCRDKKDIICGHISKGEPDYADMVDWLGDLDEHSNRIFLIQTDGLKKYAYPGNPATLVETELDQWLSDFKAGKLPTYSPPSTPDPQSEQL